MVTDPTDPKLAHLDGLNLSRAWMLEGIVSGLPASDARRSALQATAKRHRDAGLKAVTGEHYTVFGYGGLQVRDNIHSTDVVRAFAAFARAPASAARAARHTRRSDDSS